MAAKAGPARCLIKGCDLCRILIHCKHVFARTGQNEAEGTDATVQISNMLGITNTVLDEGLQDAFAVVRRLQKAAAWQTDFSFPDLQLHTPALGYGLRAFARFLPGHAGDIMGFGKSGYRFTPVQIKRRLGNDVQIYTVRIDRCYGDICTGRGRQNGCRQFADRPQSLEISSTKSGQPSMPITRSE